MFHLSISRPLLRYSHPTRRERQTMRAVLTHLPTGRKWFFDSRRAGIRAMQAMTAAVAEGRLTVLEPVAA